MSKLVGEREHPRRLGIGAVHENKRRVFIAQHEAAEFLWIERPVIVQSHNSASRNEDANAFGRIAKSAERFLPRGMNLGPVRVQAELLADARGQRNDVARL